ncbi:hypothetical protein BCU75_09585 [Vibrio splendidus]|nr:hypothetical protein BCU75_09585 [Vibrio splendidus]
MLIKISKLMAIMRFINSVVLVCHWSTIGIIWVTLLRAVLQYKLLKRFTLNRMVVFTVRTHAIRVREEVLCL